MELRKDKTIVLMLTHYAFRSEEGEDTDQRILRYLKDRVTKIVLITHPFPDFGFRYSYCTVYKNGVKIRELKIYVPKGPPWFQYLYHVVLIYYFLLKVGIIWDICIALENLSFISILPLRLLYLIKRLVYYSIDFSPKRFTNPFLNWIYHWMDKISCKASDNNWVMVKQQIDERKKFGITRLNSSPFIIVPIGYEIKNINVLPFDKIDFYSIIYAGGFRESYGPQLAIKALPLLIKRFPKIRLTIIGIGKLEGHLKDLIKKLKIAKFVDFKGFIPKFKDLTDVIAKHSVALAPYTPIPGSYSYYSDPSKIKLYMCCGLPVITTSVATISNLISKTHSGIIINYSEKSLSDTVAYLLSNRKRYKSYKDAAIKLSKRFDINNILSNAFKKIP